MQPSNVAPAAAFCWSVKVVRSSANFFMASRSIFFVASIWTEQSHSFFYQRVAVSIIHLPLQLWSKRNLRPEMNQKKLLVKFLSEQTQLDGHLLPRWTRSHWPCIFPVHCRTVARILNQCFITTSEINRTFFDNWGVIIYIYLDFSLLLCWIRLSFLSIPQLSHKPWA